MKLKQQENSSVSDTHLLEGAVKKRQNMFKSALQMPSLSMKNNRIERGVLQNASQLNP